MIIKSKPLSPFFLKFGTAFLGLVFKRRFNKLVIHDIPIKPGHSYVLMCNHFSFWDGFWAFYLANKVIREKHGMKRLYTMSVKKQMEKKRWLQYCGSFSVDPGRFSMRETFDYAANILSEPGNVLLFFPQANLETCHIRHIELKEGISVIIPKVKGDCQLIWCSNIIEYFESLRPSVYCNMFDCGTNHEFDFDTLKQQVNEHHHTALNSTIRFTKEPAEQHS